MPRRAGFPQGAVHDHAHGQFGDRVNPMQFVRHGSVEHGGAALPRRQRSRDRPISSTRNRTLSPAQAAARQLSEGRNMHNTRTDPAGNREPQDWLEALHNMDDRVSRLETQQRAAAQGVAVNTETIHRMRDEFAVYREKVAQDIFDH